MGHTRNLWKPEEIEFFGNNDLNVSYATGGDYHSLFLTEGHEVFVSGRNDEGQLGLEVKEIEAQLEKIRLQRQENKKILSENSKNNIVNEEEKLESNEDKEIRDDVTKSGMIIDIEAKSKSEEKVETIENVVNNLSIGDHSVKGENIQEEQEERDDDGFMLYPVKLSFFDSATRPVDSVYSSMNFSYAMDSKNNQLFSWGMGESYVLGNKKDDNQETPFTIPKGFFLNKIVDQISLGSQHVVVALYDPSSEQPKPVLEYDLQTYKEELRKQAEAKKTKTGKRKVEETLKEIKEEEEEAKEKNIPRRSQRPKSEKKPEAALPVKRERSQSKKKATKSKSKSKSKAKTEKKEKKVNNEENVEITEKKVQIQPIEEEKKLPKSAKSKKASKPSKDEKSEPKAKAEPKSEKSKKERSKSKSKEPKSTKSAKADKPAKLEKSSNKK